MSHVSNGKCMKIEIMMKYNLQGSVVVFGAWSTWTDDYDEYIADVDNKNYCAYTPMMTAFVILILKWVNINASGHFSTYLPLIF